MQHDQKNYWKRTFIGMGLIIAGIVVVLLLLQFFFFRGCVHVYQTAMPVHPDAAEIQTVSSHWNWIGGGELGEFHLVPGETVAVREWYNRTIFGARREARDNPDAPTPWNGDFVVRSAGDGLVRVDMLATCFYNRRV